MSKAGSKIIKGLKEARAVAKGEPPPGTRVYAYSMLETDADRLRLLSWMAEVFKLRSMRRVKVSITIEFPTKENEAHGRKS